jgi:hypothetical protein
MLLNKEIWFKLMLQTFFIFGKLREGSKFVTGNLLRTFQANYNEKKPTHKAGYKLVFNSMHTDDQLNLADFGEYTEVFIYNNILILLQG